MDAPVQRRCPHRRQRAGDAIDKVQRHDGRIERRRTLLTRTELSINPANWPQHADECIQDMKSGAGQSAAGRFLGRQPPAGDDILRIFIAVMAFDVKDRAQFAARNCVSQHAHRWPEAPVMADGESDACFAASVEHPSRIGLAQREWLIAEHLLSRGGTGDHLCGMQRMRRCQQDRADRAIREDRVQIVGQLKMMFSAKAVRSFDVGLDGTDDLQPLVAERGLDEIAAPAAQADHRSWNHRETSVTAGRCRIASITAALSLSGPSSAMAARNRSDWAVVTGRARPNRMASSRINSASFRVWEICDSGRKSRVSIFSPFVSMTREYAADSRAAARKARPSSPRRSASAIPSASAALLF